MNAVDVAPRALRHYGARFGYSLFVAKPEQVEELPELRKSLAEALRNDTRVQWVQPGDDEPVWDRVEVFYPGAPAHPHGHGEPQFLAALDFRPTPSFSQPLLFCVRVPTKNQPKPFGDESTAETYWGAWNGVVLVVLWEDYPGEVAMGNGHICVEVVGAAILAVGGTQYVQRCSIDCSDEFAHALFAISALEGDGDDGAVTFKTLDESMEFEVAMDSDDAKSTVEKLFYELKFAAHTFGQMKNTGRRLLDIEHFARYDLTEVLSLQRERAETSEEPFRKQLKRRWNARGQRTHLKSVLANLWLTLASTERLKREWHKERVSFQRSVRDTPGLGEVFSNDDHVEAEVVQTLNMASLQAATEHVAGRMDTGAIIFATIAGAVGGAIIGAVIGVLI